MAGVNDYASRCGPTRSRIGCCWMLLLLISVSNAAESWYHHTSNLNISSAGVCTSGLDPDLSLHFSEAVLDIMLFQATGDNGSAKLETCSLVSDIINQIRTRTNQTFVFLSPSKFKELDAATTYSRLLGQSADIVAFQPAVAGRLPASADYMSESGRFARGGLRTDQPGQLTAVPAISEIANATYSFMLLSNWSYVGLLWEAEPGSARLSQQLLSLGRTDRRICFPLLLSFNSENATDAVRALKDLVYSSKRLPRFTIVFAGSGAAFLRLWDLVSGGDSAFADSEKRYQLVLVGDAFSSFHRMSDTTRRKNLGLGTVFIFPGILDPEPATDELGTLFANLTADAASMGRFSELQATHGRLNWLKQSTSSQCVWSDSSSLCYLLALRCDFQALSLALLLADGVPSLGSLADVQSLRQKTVTLASLRTKFTLLNSFVRAGFTTYSMDRGLQHTSRGFWQPIVKIYQSQLRGTSYSLEKLGELALKQAGTAAQTYEFNATGVSKFYQLTSGNPDIFPTLTSSFASECPASCPECVSDSDKQFIQFKEGDIYLGALVPVFFAGNDAFNCSDGTFRTQNVGGYEFAMAFKFVVEMVDALSQGNPMPKGFNTSQVDQQFLIGVRDLLQRVHDRRAKRLRWGYVVLDTCYSPSCTVRRLGSLLDGSLVVVPGFNFTKVVGFVGAHGSSQTAQAAELLKTYNLPLITYGSTAAELSNVAEYPNVLRTGVSTSTVVQVMLDTLKYLKVSYIVAVYVNTDFGTSLKNELLQRASDAGLCIGQLILYDCKILDSSCKQVVMSRLRESKARFVPFLADLGNLQAFLSYDQAETDIGKVTFLTTQSVGTSEAAYTGRNNVGIGALSMQFEAADSPAFLSYERQWAAAMPLYASQLSQWDRLHFESINQCYLTTAFVRNPLYSVPCTDTLLASRGAIGSLESRTPLVVQATETLVLGTLTAVAYMCSTENSEPVCPAFYHAQNLGQASRANLIMYGVENAGKPQRFAGNFEGTAWTYQKIFDNRMGRLTVSVWQYRKRTAEGFQYVKIGNYNGVSTSFADSVESIVSQERAGSAISWCTSRDSTQAACTSLTCVATPDSSTVLGAPSTGTTTRSSIQLQGLWGLLGLLGVCLGLLVVLLLNCISKSKACGRASPESDYDEPMSEGTQEPEKVRALPRPPPPPQLFLQSVPPPPQQVPQPQSELEMMNFTA